MFFELLIGLLARTSDECEWNTAIGVPQDQVTTWQNADGGLYLSRHYPYEEVMFPPGCS